MTTHARKRLSLLEGIRVSGHRVAHEWMPNTPAGIELKLGSRGKFRHRNRLTVRQGHVVAAHLAVLVAAEAKLFRWSARVGDVVAAMRVVANQALTLRVGLMLDRRVDRAVAGGAKLRRRRHKRDRCLVPLGRDAVAGGAAHRHRRVHVLALRLVAVASGALRRVEVGRNSYRVFARLGEWES